METSNLKSNLWTKSSIYSFFSFFFFMSVIQLQDWFYFCNYKQSPAASRQSLLKSPECLSELQSKLGFLCLLRKLNITNISVYPSVQVWPKLRFALLARDYFHSLNLIKIRFLLTFSVCRWLISPIFPIETALLHRLILAKRMHWKIRRGTFILPLYSSLVF